MNILLVHSRHRLTGGEETSVEHEAELLESAGHRVVRYELDNADLEEMPPPARLVTTVWNRTSHRQVRALLSAERFDVVHVHNWFGMVSPSVYHASRAEGVPVVQTLHDFRIVCVNGQLVRDARPCEDCVGRRLAWPGIRHACYGDSRVASAGVAITTAVHRAARTWDRMIDEFTVPSEAARQRLVRGGLPSDRIHVRPNYLAHDPGPGPGGGGYVAFVGRLSAEKGVEVLVQAVEQLAGRVRVVVVGDGPLRAPVQQAHEQALVEWMGWRTPDQVLEVVGRAEAVIVPSVATETFGRSVLEAYARGTPVVASAVGALAEIVEDGRTGYLVPPGDPTALARALERVLDHPAALRQAARRAYDEQYAPEPNLRRLEAIYARAISRGATT